MTDKIRELERKIMGLKEGIYRCENTGGGGNCKACLFNKEEIQELEEEIKKLKEEEIEK